MKIQSDPAGIGEPAVSLPAWTYRNPAFFEIEKKRILARSWQVVCHLSDIENAGDYYRFDFLDEPLLIVRDTKRRVRAYSNVCRHRAARLLDGENGTAGGHCSNGMIKCPYHSWTYDLDGQLKFVPNAGSYGGFDTDKCRLPEYATDIWMGFVFVSIDSVTPRISDVMAQFDQSLAPLRIPDMRALGRVTMRPRSVNWKNIVDNYIDGLHIRIAHPGLRGIAGNDYRLVAGEHVQHIQSRLIADAKTRWSERMYLRVLPDRTDLPVDRRRLWEYFMLWPNIAFDIYPDQIDFMQMLPLGPTETVIREISYGLPDASREMKLARYLNWRINRVVNAEDHQLVRRVQHGLGSRDFSQGPFSESEVCLRAFADRIRRLIPIAGLASEPPGSLDECLSAVD